MGFFYLMSEQEFKNELILSYSKHFIVEKEVWSKCGKRRIDLVLTHLIYKDISFGMECKRPNKKRGKDIGEYIKQAHDYSKLEWNCDGIYKKIPILICPPLSYKYFILNEKTIIIDGKKWHQDRHDENNFHHTINSFLAAFNVGEVRKKHGKYYFSFNNETIFDTVEYNKNNETFTNHIHFNNYNELIKRINND